MADDNLGIPLPEPAPQRLISEFNPTGAEPRQGMSFGENVAGSFRSGTIEGAISEKIELDSLRGRSPQATPSDLAWIAAGTDPALLSSTQIDPWRSPIPEADKLRARREADERAFYDQVAYDLNPSRFTPASVAGTVVGTMAAPTNFAGIATVLRNVTALAARPIVVSAINAGVMTGATDLATQGIRVQSGAQEDFELARAVMAPFLGAAIGAGGHVAIEGVRRLPPALARLLRSGDEVAPPRAADAPAPAVREPAEPSAAPEPRPSPEQPPRASSESPQGIRAANDDARSSIAARPEPDEAPPARLPDLPEGVRVVDPGGEQGPVLDGFGGRWGELVEWMRAARTGDARGVLQHPDVPGPIDVIWGNAKGGLRHIDLEHGEIINDLPAILQSLRAESISPNRIVLASEDHRAIVRLTLDDETKTWLLTAYDAALRRSRRAEGSTERPGASGADTSSAPPTKGNIAPPPPDDEPPPVLYRSRASAQARFDSEAKAIGDEIFRAAKADDQPSVGARTRSADPDIAEKVTSPHPNEMRKGRPLVDQGTPLEPEARVARIEDLSKQFAADFENILRTGRVKPRALGQYNIKTGVSRVRTLSDLDTVVHEVGHSLHLDPANQKTFDGLIAAHRAELEPVGAGQGKTGDREAFAELFRLYAMNRLYAEKTYPGATAALDRIVRAEFPDQAAALDRLRANLDALHRADSGAVVSADVVTPAPDGLFSRMLNALGMRNVGGNDIDPKGRSIYAWRDALFTRYIDSKNPVLKAVEGLSRIHRENTGKTLDLLPADDPYIRARLASRSNNTADSILKNGVIPADGVNAEGPSFWGAIETAIGRRWTQQQWHEFGAYTVARRMVAEYDRFLAGEIPNPPGKFSQADYARAVAEFEAANPSFAQGAAQLYEFQQRYLQRGFDSHLFTSSYFDAATAKRDYVPLHRDMADLGHGQTVNRKSGDVRTSLMQSFRGSQRSPLNPLDMIFKRVHDLEFEIASNETKRALARLAETAGPGSGFIAEPIPATKLTATHIDILDALKKAGQKANVDATDLGALMHQAEGLLGDDMMAKVFRQEPIRPGQEPITFYFENGQRKALRLADGRYGNDLYHALNAMTDAESNIFVATLVMSQELLRAMVTKSVGFIYRNFVRDQFTSTATAGRHYVPILSAIRGGIDVIFKGGDFERYIGRGGFAGGLINEAIEASARGRNAQAFRERSVFDPIRYAKGVAKVIELSEASTRSGLFKSYFKQAQGLGYDELNAVLYATFKSNDYIDFSKAGSQMQWVRRFVPFLNAALQGTEREYRALIGDMVKLETRRYRGETLTAAEADRLKDARIAWLRVLTLGSVLGGGTAYMNAQNEEWSKAAGFRRSSDYLIFPIGDGRWFVAPKPFGFVRNISDLFEYATEFGIRRDPTILGKLGSALADSHHLPYTNPLVDTFYNVRSNYDPFRGRAIVPFRMQGVQPSEQYTPATSEVAKHIGEVTGWSPMKVDYVMKNLGAGMARDFLYATDNLLRNSSREKTLWEAPLMRELVKNLSWGNQITEQFFKQVGAFTGSLEQASKSYQVKLAAGDRAGAADFLRDMSEDQRAWTTLMSQGFGIGDKLLHPLFAARTYTDVLSGMSRELVNDNLIKQSDIVRGQTHLSRRDAKPIQLEGPIREKIITELQAAGMAYARNALLATNAPGIEGIPKADPQVFLDRVRMLSPEVAKEFEDRLATKKPHDLDKVAELWPEVRARLLKDGEKADFSDIAPHRAGRKRRKTARPSSTEDDDE